MILKLFQDTSSKSCIILLCGQIFLKKALTGRIKLVKIVYVADTKIIHEATQAQIAQLVEQRTENPRVTGSIPVLGIPV